MDKPINVAELIKILQDMPDEASVCKRGDDGGKLSYLTTVFFIAELKSSHVSKDFVFLDFNRLSEPDKI